MLVMVEASYFHLEHGKSIVCCIPLRLPPLDIHIKQIILINRHPPLLLPRLNLPRRQSQALYPMRQVRLGLGVCQCGVFLGY